MNQKSIRVLVTGGAGFIGSRLTRYLLAGGIRVVILDNLSKQIHGDVPKDLNWLECENVDFIRGSVTNPRDLEEAINGVTHIVHLAAETGTGQSMYDISKYCLVNTQGTANIFNLLANTKHHSIKRVVLSSSRSVYGEGAYVCKSCNLKDKIQRVTVRDFEKLSKHIWDPICSSCSNSLVPIATPEDHAVEPASIYAATKYAQEDLVRIGCKSMGIDFAICRLQNVYGDGQSLFNPYTGILSIFTTRIRRGQELPVFEDGQESRDFVHVDDVAKSLFLCVTKIEPISQVINIGSGVPTSVLVVAQTLSNCLGQSPRIRITSEFRVGDIRHNFADIRRMNSVLGYGPSVLLSDGIRRFCDWALTKPIAEDRLDVANSELRARKLMGN